MGAVQKEERRALPPFSPDHRAIAARYLETVRERIQLRDDPIRRFVHEDH
jgi:hypothetical protein